MLHAMEKHNMHPAAIPITAFEKAVGGGTYARESIEDAYGRQHHALQKQHHALRSNMALSIINTAS